MQTGEDVPPLLVHTIRGSQRAHGVAILDAEGNEIVRVVYDARKQFPIRIETKLVVKAITREDVSENGKP